MKKIKLPDPFKIRARMEKKEKLAVLLDDDARFILEHMVYPDRRGVYYFFEYFCEYLADARIIDYQLCEAEEDGELVDIERIWEEEENE